MQTNFLKFILVLLFLGGCASYTETNQQMRMSLYRHDYKGAVKAIDSSPASKNNRDKVLYHMERGTIFYVEGNYDEAVKEWNKASRRMEELFTVSISSTAASLAVSESYTDYDGEMHEKLLTTTFSAIAYFANDEVDKAIVEARRTNVILKQISEKDEKKEFIDQDTFSLYLTGLIYEAKGEWDAAIVDYRRALEAANAQKSWMTTIAPEIIARDLARLADFRNRPELITTLKKSYPNLKWTKHQDLLKMGEVYVIYEAGKSPIKVPQDIVLPGLINGNVMRVSYPTYRDQPSLSSGAKVLLNGVSVGEVKPMQDIGALARRALAARRGKDLAKMVVRLVAKDQAARAMGRNFGQFGQIAQLATSVAGAVTETADTRGWSTLPRTIQVLRVPVKAGVKSQITIQPDNGASKIIDVTLRAGEKKLVRARGF